MTKSLAQITGGTLLGRLRGLGPLGEIPNGLETPTVFLKFTKILSTSIGVLTIAGGIWFIFQIFSGTLQWLTSGGEKQALQNAQKRIVNAIIGLLVIVLSYAFVSVVGLIFGFNILSPVNSLLGIGGSPTPPPVPGPGPY